MKEESAKNKGYTSKQYIRLREDQGNDKRTPILPLKLELVSFECPTGPKGFVKYENQGAWSVTQQLVVLS